MLPGAIEVRREKPGHERRDVEQDEEQERQPVALEQRQVEPDRARLQGVVRGEREEVREPEEWDRHEERPGELARRERDEERPHEEDGEGRDGRHQRPSPSPGSHSPEPASVGGS